MAGRTQHMTSFSMSRVCSLRCKLFIGLILVVVFVCYSWVNICHRPQVGTIHFICRQGSYNVQQYWQEDEPQPRDDKLTSPPRKEPETFSEAVQLYANSRNIIILSVLDMGCLDMATNLYLSSFKKMDITNYLFLSSDTKACPEMRKELPDVHCIHYADDTDADKPSSFGSKAFIRKTYIKSEAVQQALLMDYYVLLMDIDIVLFKDPFPYFEKCSDCDLQIQWDHGSVCSGFYYIKPTDGGKLFMKKVWEIAEKSSMKGREQTSFQKAVNGLKGYKGFKHIILPEKEFPNGFAYFHSKKIMFATDGYFPPQSYLVHDNWIISQAAKIYRFKENFMWVYDKNGYYSNPDEKYLLYIDKFANGRGTVDLETQALKTALLMGYILDRIVIFPTFSCYSCNIKKFKACQVKSKQCSFITSFRVEQFDKQFPGLYREHMFLQHPKVPLTVKQSKSPVLIPDTFKDAQSINPKNGKVFPLKNNTTVTDLKNWFSGFPNTSVLVFDHLQTAWSILSKEFQDEDISKRIKLAIKRTNYLQE